MNSNKRFHHRLRNAAYVSIITAAVLLLLIYFKGLLQPLALAVVVWYIIKGLRNLMAHLHIRGHYLPVALQYLFSFLIIVGVFVLTIELITININRMASDIPVYEANLHRILENTGSSIGVENVLGSVKNFVSDLNLQSLAVSVASTISSAMGTIFLIIVYIVFLILEEEVFSNKLHAIFSNDRKRSHLMQLLHQIDHSSRRYLNLKTYISLLTGILSFVALTIIGVDYAFLWSFIIFLFNYIPYIGSLIATLLPTLFALLQFGSFGYVILVFGVVETIQIIVGNYIEPRITGKSLNLSPLAVMIALTFWGALWGVLGMFLSVPITSVMLIIMAQFSQTRSLAVMLSEKGSLSGLVSTDKVTLATSE